MNAGRHIVGIGFCAIAAFLYGLNYLVVAAFASSLTEWGDPPGRIGTAAMKYSNDWLVLLSVVSLIAGIAFLLWAEATAWSARRDA